MAGFLIFVKNMANLQSVFSRIQKSKKEQRDIKKMYHDALNNSQSFQKMVEELKIMRDKKKKFEDSMKDEFRSEMNKLETLKVDIENDNMLLSDAALTELVSGKMVQVTDEYETKYEPIFSVRFKKAG